MEGTREKLPAQVQKEVAAVPQQLAEGMDVAEVAKHGLETELVLVLDLHSLAEIKYKLLDVACRINTHYHRCV